MEQKLESVTRCVYTGNQHEVVKLVTEALSEGIAATEILEKGLVPGIQALGEKFKDGTVFLPEVMISARAMKFGVEKLRPHLAENVISNKGIVVLGTVEGDLHDIGKNLVGMMLESGGYKVVDVGVDATVETFIQAVQENDADILAMSGLLTTTMPIFATVVRALQEAGLKDKVDSQRFIIKTLLSPVN